MFKKLASQVLDEVKAEREAGSVAHQRLRQAMKESAHKYLPGFKQVGKTGVIYVMSRAREFGFSYENEEWSNFGQGAPETGKIANQPERELEARFNSVNNEYAPVAGTAELRKKVSIYLSLLQVFFVLGNNLTVMCFF